MRSRVPPRAIVPPAVALYAASVNPMVEENTHVFDATFTSKIIPLPTLVPAGVGEKRNPLALFELLTMFVPPWTETPLA